MPDGQVSLATIAREWTRIGCIGFGGPPTHIVLLRKLCVSDRGWISMTEFEDGIAATNLLPGPASTQLAILCAWRLRRRLGALVGGHLPHAAAGRRLVEALEPECEVTVGRHLQTGVGHVGDPIRIRFRGIGR